MRLCVCVGGGGGRKPRGKGAAAAGGRSSSRPCPRGVSGLVAADAPPPRCAGSPRNCGPSSSAASFPFPPGACRVGAPAPRPPAAAPPRLPPHAALARLRKGPGASPRGRGPTAGQGALRGGGRAGWGAGLRARIPLGSGTSCTAQGAGRGGGGPGEGTALQLLRPRPPHPPKKRSSRGEAHRCLHYIMSPPLPPRPPRTPRLGGEPGRSARCSVGNGPTPAWGAREGGDRNLLSPSGGCGGRLATEPSRPPGC